MIQSFAAFFSNLWKIVSRVFYLVFVIPFKKLTKRPLLFGVVLIVGCLLFLYFTEHYLVTHSTNKTQTAEILLLIRGFLLTVLTLEFLTKVLIPVLLVFIVSVILKHYSIDFWQWCLKPLQVILNILEFLTEKTLQWATHKVTFVWERIKLFLPWRE